jgi:hypothetical protein
MLVVFSEGKGAEERILAWTVMAPRISVSIGWFQQIGGMMERFDAGRARKRWFDVGDLGFWGDDGTFPGASSSDYSLHMSKGHRTSQGAS